MALWRNGKFGKFSHSGRVTGKLCVADDLLCVHSYKLDSADFCGCVVDPTQDSITAVVCSALHLDTAALEEIKYDNVTFLLDTHYTCVYLKRITQRVQ